MNIKTEHYKGYPMKFVEKIINGKTVVVGEVPTKIIGKSFMIQGPTKSYVESKCKAMIDHMNK